VVTRRDFLKALAVAPVAQDFSPKEVKRDFSPAKASSVAQDFSSASMRFGYAAITWEAAVTQAIDDIAAVGFRGIQLRSEAFAQFGNRPRELRDLLDRRRLAFPVLSSGNLSIDPAREQEMIATHVGHARFLRDAGGTYLQVIDERPKGRPVVADDYRRLGRLLSELGKRTEDLGISLVYHHHMNSTGEKPHEVQAVLNAADPKHARLLFDIAHYQQGGGDPAAALRKYKEWIEIVHLKDVRAGRAGLPAEARSAEAGGTRDYEFVELGRGRVDLPAVFAALRDIAFDKWAIVELDKVPDPGPGRTPKRSAEDNKQYLIDRGFTV
jgi:inosose dehydratase